MNYCHDSLPSRTKGIETVTEPGSHLVFTVFCEDHGFGKKDEHIGKGGGKSMKFTNLSSANVSTKRQTWDPGGHFVMIQP